MSAERLPRELRESRYIVEPGGQLRATATAGVTPNVLPPPIRVLTAAEVQTLWNLSSAETALAGPQDLEAADAETTARAVARPTVIISVAGRGIRRTAVTAFTGDPEQAERRLVRSLADLAWVQE